MPLCPFRSTLIHSLYDCNILLIFARFCKFVQHTPDCRFSLFVDSFDSYVKLCESRHAFFFASLSTECVAAIGSAATDTAALAIVAQVFPQNVAKMIVSIFKLFSLTNMFSCTLQKKKSKVIKKSWRNEGLLYCLKMLEWFLKVPTFQYIPLTKKKEDLTGSLHVPVKITWCDGFTKQCRM